MVDDDDLLKHIRGSRTLSDLLGENKTGYEAVIGYDGRWQIRWTKAKQDFKKWSEGR